MSNKLQIAACAVIIFLITASVALGNYQVSPSQLSIDKKIKITSLNFQNNLDEEKVFQVTVLKKVSEDKITKKKTYKATKDLMVTPLVFKILPKRKQLIRVALMNPKATTKERDDYRISIKDLPQGKLPANGINFITEMRIPVTIENKSV